MVEKAKATSKKKSRKNVKYPALNPNYNLKTRYEEIMDINSYAKDLPPEAKAWLNSFVSEEICANLNHGGQQLNDPNDPETRSRIYNKNNARNRCIYTQEIAQGTMNYLEEIDIDGERNLEDEESYD